MLSDLLMWNKIGRIVMRLSEKLEVSPLRALEYSICQRFATDCMTLKPNFIFLVTLTSLMKS